MGNTPTQTAIDEPIHAIEEPCPLHILLVGRFNVVKLTTKARRMLAKQLSYRLGKGNRQAPTFGLLCQCKGVITTQEGEMGFVRNLTKKEILQSMGLNLMGICG